MFVKIILMPILLFGVCAGQKNQNPLHNLILGKRAALPDTTTDVSTTTLEDPKKAMFNESAALPDDMTMESIIKTIYAGLPVSVESSETELSYFLPCGDGKVCVSQHLCRNDDIIENGATLEGDEHNSYYQCRSPDKCCAAENVVTLSEGCSFRNNKNVSELLKTGQEADNNAEFGEFPWMVAVLEQKTRPSTIVFSVYKCGGSLLTPKVVLTAAHCVHNIQARNLLARAGEWESNSDVEPFTHQDRQVVEIVAHEHHDQRNLLNDIAILFLEANFHEAPHINTICLPPVGANFDTSRCFVTGWGKINGKYSNILKKIDVPVVPNAKCQRDLRKTTAGNSFELHHSFMCAGGEPDKGTCKGFGGSPLICPMFNNSDRYFQAGIVAWGIECGVENVPGVYANVPYFRTWIDDHLAYKNIDKSLFQPRKMMIF